MDLLQDTLSDDGNDDDDHHHHHEYTYYLNLQYLFLLQFCHSQHISMLKTIITETFFNTVDPTVDFK